MITVPHLDKDSLTVLLTAKQIHQLNKKLAQQITQDYKDKAPVLIGLCNGAIFFLADLVRQLNFQIEIDTMKLSSYHGSFKAKGKVEIQSYPSINLHNRHIIIVDEIIDTGQTLKTIIDYLEVLKPTSIKTCVLLNKLQARSFAIEVDYMGAEINEFVIGYGLDYQNFYRNLPYIAGINFFQ